MNSSISSLVEKRPNDASATHHPDVFSLFFPQTDCERFDWFLHEFHARRRRRLQRIVCEDIVLNFGIKGRPGHAFF
jgi:hypothetical protein